MLVEFFWATASRFAVAWGGLLVIVAHALVHGWVKFALNDWYKEFYNLLETAGALAAAEEGEGGRGSGEDGGVPPLPWEERQAEVMEKLVDFVRIAAIAVVVMPLAKLVRSAWALQWRLALMHAYTNAWNPNRPPIEGASQRVHEDTYRFARGVELCLTTVLDSVVTLFVFIPVLTSLGEATPCPDSLRAFSWLGDGWLVGLATTSALVGFLVTLLLGHSLVRLEVENQVVEAKLRRDLVVLETSPSSICCYAQDETGLAATSRTHHQWARRQERSSGSGEGANGREAEQVTAADFEAVTPPPVLAAPLPHFLPTFEGIQRNYNRLFVNFTLLNLWLAIFDQFNILLPYLVFAPLLFDPDPSKRILLGTLVQVSNSFDKVFGSLSVVAENWAGVNEFRSVLRRLCEFERNLYHGIPHPSRSLRSLRSGSSPFSTSARALFGPPIDVVHTETDEGEGGSSDVQMSRV